MKNKDLFLIIILILIDQISKVLISYKLNYLEVKNIINNFFYLTYVKNTGSAFSILEGKRILLIILSIVFLIILIKYLTTSKNKERIYILLIISGLLGNLVDRILTGKVVDFLGFNIFGYKYPIFNIADSYVVIGVIILLIINIGSDVNDRIKSRRK